MLLLLALFACNGDDTDTDTGYVPEEIGRCASSDPLRQPFFGDTHVHTRLSLDANLQGTLTSPVQAYRFAKGEPIDIQPLDTSGQPTRRIQLARPLDFVMLSDHAEFLGTVSICTNPDAAGYDSSACALYRDNPDAAFIGLNALTARNPDATRYPPMCDDEGVDCATAQEMAWLEVQEAAEGAYDRTDACTFTTFVGYEWSGGPGAQNLHRNVVFRNEVVPDVPASYFDEPWVEDLWASLRSTCIDSTTGCDALTIPHNSNLSNGLMFEQVGKGGQPIDAAYAAERHAMEPLAEVFQHKGDSECRPGDPSGDELCAFEDMPYSTLSGANLDIEGEPMERDYVRDALGQGLVLEARLGANPFQYGLIASTDTHIGAPGQVAEDAFPGHGGAGQPNRDELPVGFTDVLHFNPGGLAVLWAEENSREALYQAMLRKEAYGTSGPRITLRFFGGDLASDLCSASDLPAQGYADGVPMGGTLQGGTPSFVVSAAKDPSGASLQRLQIIKGWVEGGQPQWAVHDIATDTGDASIDTATCAVTGTGAASLCQQWSDPDFDPSQPAFYYVRVLEHETCRWTQHQCVQAAVDCSGTVPSGYEGCCTDEVPKTVQERAWSSPIWYTP